ncbi:MAG: hypothetical protein ABIA97_06295 [Candidatus Omnitrophota bacterium]
MIKINLLPTGLRRKEIVEQIPLPAIVYFTVLIVLAIHLILFVLIVYKKMQFGSLNQTWERMRPQHEEVSLLKEDLMVKRDNAKVMEYILVRNIYFTEFLSKINQAVPKGLWLNRLSFSYDGLVIAGNVFSFGTEEVSLVNKFFNVLKNDQFFTVNFDNFNLDSVQRRMIKEYEVLDFLLTADIKEERFKIQYSDAR